MPTVQFRLWAAARAAAGAETIAVEADSIADALARADRGPEFDKVAAISTILIDGRRVDDLHGLIDGPVVAEVLPPFAGG